MCANGILTSTVGRKKAVYVYVYMIYELPLVEEATGKFLTTIVVTDLP